jgi:hypothetical protein
MSNLQNRDAPENSPEYVPPTTPKAKTNGEDLDPPKTGKGAKAKVRKPSAESEPETTLERAESLPDETQAAPEPPPLGEADDLDDLLSSAIAPDDDDVALAEMEMGQPDYPRSRGGPRHPR